MLSRILFVAAVLLIAGLASTRPHGAEAADRTAFPNPSPVLERWTAYPDSWRSSELPAVVDQAVVDREWDDLRERLQAMGYVN